MLDGCHAKDYEAHDNTTIKERGRKGLEDIREYQVNNYPQDAVRLDLNESPVPPPSEAREAMARELERVNRYPEAELVKAAVEAIAGYSGVKPGMIALAGGGDYGILTVLSLYAQDAGRIIVPEYTFTMTTVIAAALGLEVARIPVYEHGDEWRIDEDKLFQEARQGGMIIIDHPNNPTGSLLIESSRIRELAEEAQGPILVDEAYYDFSRETLAGAIEGQPNIIILRTMSKAFALAGMRIGYLIAEEKKATIMRTVAPFPVSRPALAAAAVLAGNPSFTRQLVKQIEDEKKHLAGELKRLGMKPYKSRTNFLLVETGAPRLWEKLKNDNIYVKSTPIRETMIRVSIGRREDSERLITSLQSILDKSRDT